MTLKTTIRDGTGTGNLAKVSSAGELVITGVGNNITAFRTITPVNTPINFFSPIPDQEFFITSILTSGPDNTNVNIFEASSPTSNTTERLIYTISFTTSTFIPIVFPFGGFLRINEGSFINARTDKVVTTMTIIGYYRSVI